MLTFKIWMRLFFFTFVICQHTPALHINIFYISIHVSYTIRLNNTYVVTNNTFGFKSVWKTFSSFFYLESFRDFKSESPYESYWKCIHSAVRVFFFFVLFLETTKNNSTFMSKYILFATHTRKGRFQVFFRRPYIF